MQPTNSVRQAPPGMFCTRALEQAAGAAVTGSSGSELAVQLTAVSKIYGSFAALRNLSLSLPNGTCTVVLGENGAGKSTLLRLLAGLTAPTLGRVLVLNGEPQLQRGRIAYMSHAPMLYDELSAIENLKYFAALHRDEGCDCVASPEMALRAVGLDPALTRPVSQFSQGMRQRASLARVLQTDPEILLLDEPFSNLDVASAREIVALLGDFVTWPKPARPFAAEKRSVVLTTHQAHLAESIAAVTLTLRNGALLTQESRA